MKLIDLTHTFEGLMPIYPGDPESKISSASDMDGIGCCISQVATGMHTGTHIDGPLHVLEGGLPLSEVSLEKFIGRGVLVDARGKEVIDADLLADVNLRKDDIVIVLTGRAASFRDPFYYSFYPRMTPAFAEALVKAGVNMLGMDTPGPDDAPFTVHRLLLGSQVLIIENLANLEALLEFPEFDIIALPAKFRAEAAPARVIALVA